MRASVIITGSLEKVFDDWSEQNARRLTDVTEHAASTMRDEMRSAMSGAGLGNLGRALGYAAYPGGGTYSFHPAAEVFVRGRAPSAAKWEGIIDAFNEGATIRSKRGWLAIPTKNCPKGSRGRYLSPDEVAKRFGPPRSQHSRDGRSLLLFFNVVAGRSGGYRRDTTRRRAQGRDPAEVLMFVLIRDATIRKRLDLDAIVTRWQTRYPAMIADAVRER